TPSRGDPPLKGLFGSAQRGGPPLWRGCGAWLRRGHGGNRGGVPLARILGSAHEDGSKRRFSHGTEGVFYHVGARERRQVAAARTQGDGAGGLIKTRSEAEQRPAPGGGAP